ncbi:hypothetical protein NQ318_020740 [Aromia moschata]|uniref:Uncharacterized protein n=1 Tax=Aromia moschata TaxID=1265417 RepID=A0AAV8YVU7_9CUCU|nr:hypothetical protein NQ318_020740 [Aromia moschata]
MLEAVKNNLDSGNMGNGVRTTSSNEKGTNEGSNTSSVKMGEESEEDVPGDFFDDFFKEDFMDGLDIVDDDAWDEEKMKNQAAAGEEHASKSENKVVKLKKKKQKPPEKEKTDQNEDLTLAPGAKKHKQKKKKHEDKPSEQKVKKSKEKAIDADEFDIRRDPEKTKRDIERDKARCEKDKEKKIISEKLSLVETGLVPPGMEMEIDIEEVKRQKEKIEQNKPQRDLREHLKTLRAGPALKREERGVQIKKTPMRRSPRKRSPLIRRSPLRRISPRRSPVFRGGLKRSPLRRSQERRPLRRSRSHSPIYRNRRTRYSPAYLRHRDRSASRESDREIWLKRRRTRSRSQRRKREEKKSFLQEIAEKLNETRPPLINVMPQMHFMHAQAMQAMPVPVPAPAPVPPPNTTYFASEPQSLPQSQQYDPYDQNFFIGTPQPLDTPDQVEQPQPDPIFPMGLPHQQVPLNSAPSQLVNTPKTPGTPTRPAASQNLEKLTPQTQGRAVDSNEEVTKLFQDKKITVSEFLAVTAKPEVSSASPEAIKFLEGNEKKYTGKFVVQPTDNYKVSELKNKSPLVRMPPVTFAFTQPQIKKEQKASFTGFINDLLQKVGLMREAVVDVDKEPPQNACIPATAKKLTPPPPPLITANKNTYKELQPSKPRFGSNVARLGANQLSKMVQTDVFRCESCEQRKRILHVASGVQCGGVSASFSVSTQVTEADFYAKIPITQSLASLTPAQLLAKSAKYGRGVEMDDFDAHGFNRGGFARSEGYNMARYSPPRAPSPPRFSLGARDEAYGNASASRSQFAGGGGRGRGPQSNLSRPLDPNSRFGYNNYF